MAYYWGNCDRGATYIKIPEAVTLENCTAFRVVVTVGEVRWQTLKRYSEFYVLHSTLVKIHGIDMGLLPPRTILRVQSPVLIEARRRGLEIYCQEILSFFGQTMPAPLINFFEFNKYDIYFLLRALARQISLASERMQNTEKSYTFNPVQLHSITLFLKSPLPSSIHYNEDGDPYDFSHIMELCARLDSLCIEGSNNNYWRSNIIPNTLKFGLGAFKVLSSLVLYKVDLDKIDNLGNLRSTVKNICGHNCGITNVGQVLQCDILHKCNIDPSQIWTELTELNLSDNNITSIDSAINLVPNLQVLILDNNKICSISGLTELPNLSRLSLANNQITVCSDLNMKIGNVQHLNLSQNGIYDLTGFKRLYPLVSLDLSSNYIEDIHQLDHIGSLPCLENLSLTGNKIATAVDYRMIVLGYFSQRINEIVLDNEKPIQSEVDKVTVLRALSIVKQGKAPDLNTSNN